MVRGGPGGRAQDLNFFSRHEGKKKINNSNIGEGGPPALGRGSGEGPGRRDPGPGRVRGPVI